MSTSSAGAERGGSCCCGGWAEAAGWAAGAGVSAASTCELSAIRVGTGGHAAFVLLQLKPWDLSSRVLDVSRVVLGLVILLRSDLRGLAPLDAPLEAVRR